MWSIGLMTLGCETDFNELSLGDGEVLLLEELSSILIGVKPKTNEDDYFIWWIHKDGFSMKDCYKRIHEFCFVEHTLDPIKLKALDQLWKTKIRSKILIFG